MHIERDTYTDALMYLVIEEERAYMRNLAALAQQSSAPHAPRLWEEAADTSDGDRTFARIDQFYI